MNKAAQFLRDCGTFYLATVEGDQPHVRPFGAVIEYEGKTYICTNNEKNCFKQMVANPKVEICGMVQGKWIRVCGKAIPDPRKEVKQKMLEELPFLQKMYSADDPIYEVLYLEDAVATIYSFSDEPEVIKL